MTIDRNMILSNEHRAYHEIVYPYADLHPQQQGLTYEEYSKAVIDGENTFSVLRTDAGTVRVPELLSLESASWNNIEFYTKKYPESSIYHFTPNDEVEVGDTSSALLKKIEDQNGVLIFDVPSVCVDGVDRVIRSLQLAGFSPTTPTHLGTQTYFEGKIHIDGIIESDDFSDFNSTFSRNLVSEKASPFGGKSKVDKDNGTWLYDTVPINLADHLYEFYVDAYQVLNDSPLRQGLDPEAFMRMVSEDKVSSKFVHSRNGKPQTVFISTSDIDGLDWVNSRYYAREFEDDYTRGNLLWFPGIATDPTTKDFDNFGNGQRITNLMVQLGAMGNYSPRLVFDFCDFNVGIGLHKVIERWINRTKNGQVSLNKIAHQDYYSLRLR